MRFLSTLLIITIITQTAIAADPVPKDQIILFNGRTFNGQIIKETDLTIQLQTNTRILEFKKRKVATIIYADGTVKRLQDERLLDEAMEDMTPAQNLAYIGTILLLIGILSIL